MAAIIAGDKRYIRCNATGLSHSPCTAVLTVARASCRCLRIRLCAQFLRLNAHVPFVLSWASRCAEEIPGDGGDG
jgi:hypothetical protein